MSVTNRFARSVLYMPASNPRALQKSLALRNCDAFIYDLEDAVGVEFKHQARKDVEGFMDKERSKLHPTQTAIIRVNGNTTAYYDADMETCARIKPHAVLLPKTETKQDVERVRSRLNQQSEVWCMIETPLGVLNAKEIATAADALVMGTVDLANELRCSVDFTLARSPLMMSLQLTVLAARAANIKVLDGVYTALDDDEGFHREAIQGMELGFDGKTLIHPKTIDRTNEVFSPSVKAIEKAKRIVDAYSKSAGGATLVDGKLVEELHVRRAKALLEMQKALEMKNSM